MKVLNVGEVIMVYVDVYNTKYVVVNREKEFSDKVKISKET